MISDWIEKHSKGIRAILTIMEAALIFTVAISIIATTLR